MRALENNRDTFACGNTSPAIARRFLCRAIKMIYKRGRSMGGSLRHSYCPHIRPSLIRFSIRTENENGIRTRPWTPRLWPKMRSRIISRLCAACLVKRFSVRADAQNAIYRSRGHAAPAWLWKTGLENAMEKKQTSGETTFTRQQIHRGSHCYLQADCINRCRYCEKNEKPILGRD